MKTYKVVQVSAADTFETSLNELAQAGWKVITANLAFAGGKDNTPTYFALLENSPMEDELKQLLDENSDEIDSIDLSPSAN